MTLFEAFIYGAIQGVTEYLPISSSAHLILLPKFLKHPDPGLTFDVFLHLGTLLATVIYFWREWVGILNFRGSLRQSTLPVVPFRLILIATVPALFSGALLHRFCETVFRGNQVLVFSLVLGGVVLFASDYFCSQRKTLRSANLKDAFWIGVAQCFALIPGISRSGSTMTGGRLLGFSRTEAARFSFLISAPVTFAAIVFELRNWKLLVDGQIGVGPLLTAGASSFVFGCVAIGGLLRLLRRFGYLSFLVYRVILAGVIVLALGV